MRLLFVLMLSGLWLLALGGCSEKQKEADRMEQEVKDLEAADDSSPAGTGTVELTGESAAIIPEGVPEPSTADPAAVPPESAPSTAAASAVETAAGQAETAVNQTEPVTPVLAMPPAPTGAGYTVQIASCESEDYARHLVGVYTRRGYEPFVATISYNNLVYYRVRIGHFQSVAEANALKNELADKFSIVPWVDRTE